MILRLYGFLTGTKVFHISPDSRRECANILLSQAFKIDRAAIDGDGTYSFTVGAREGRLIERLFADRGICYEAERVRGIPRIAGFLRRRPGILLGIVFTVALVFVSSRCVWSIDISGIDKLPKERILNDLEELGFTYGTYIPSVDFDNLHAKLSAMENDIAWIAVNMKGNHAFVEVREAKHKNTSEHGDGKYANVIASEDAQIVLASASSGRLEVGVGDVVRRGELLIGGVIPLGEENARYVYADGEILGRVERNVTIEIPFEDVEKAYSGRKCEHISLKIFKKTINLFGKGGIEYSTYDKIIRKEQVSLFGEIPLPLWINRETYREYGYVKASREYEDAFAKAVIELRDRCDELLENCELISRRIDYEITDTAYILHCEMVCLADIGEVSEFSVDE